MDMTGMDSSVFAQPSLEDARKLDAALAEIFAEVERIDERIARNHQETAQLREETRKILAQMKAK